MIEWSDVEYQHWKRQEHAFIMGTAELRDCFTAKGLTVTSLFMDYAHGHGPNHQIITVSGVKRDGTPFAATSDPAPPGVDPMVVASAMAHQIIGS